MEYTSDKTNLFESIIIKLQAHAKYIIPRIKDEDKRLQAEMTFNSIIAHIVMTNEPVEPENIRSLSYLITDKKVHNNVLETYEDIYFNMFKRFYGRSEDFYMEKM